MMTLLLYILFHKTVPIWKKQSLPEEGFHDSRWFWRVLHPHLKNKLVFPTACNEVACGWDGGETGVRAIERAEFKYPVFTCCDFIKKSASLCPQNGDSNVHSDAVKRFLRYGYYSLEKEMATHSSILAGIIPWTVEPGGLQSMGLQRIRQDWVTKHSKWLFPWFWQDND